MYCHSFGVVEKSGVLYAAVMLSKKTLVSTIDPSRFNLYDTFGLLLSYNLKASKPTATDYVNRYVKCLYTSEFLYLLLASIFDLFKRALICSNPLISCPLHYFYVQYANGYKTCSTRRYNRRYSLLRPCRRIERSNLHSLISRLNPQMLDPRYSFPGS